jgi:hypothetical protein
MKMLEIIKKDQDLSTENSKLAFTYGYLTHLAADQHIHRLVNEYAGSFYVSGYNRIKHRTLDVYQDLLLYQNKFPEKDFFDEKFNSWIDVGPPPKENESQRLEPEMGGEKTIVVKEYTLEWFRSFIARAFFETYSIIIENDEAEKWLKGFNSVLEFIKSIGPYHNASREISAGSLEAREFKGMFEAEDKKYLTKYFEPAKEVATKYFSAAMAFMKGKQISDNQRNVFIAQVPDADLTAPLMGI